MSVSFEFIPPPPPAPERPPTPEKRTPRPIQLKASYRSESIELDLQPISQEVFGWQSLKSKIQAAFGICNLRVKYIDDAGDSVNIDSQEEFLEAIKVAQQIGTLNITVDGDPHNPYVEDLHIKLSKPFGQVVHDKAMDTSERPSANPSAVESLHSKLSKCPVTQLRFQPYSHTSSAHHYSDLARSIGSQRRSHPSNQYIEALQKKLSQPCTREASSNPYVELLHQRLSKSGGKANVPPILARSPVTPAPTKSSSPSTPSATFKNEYVESLHAKLLQMGSAIRQLAAPCPGMLSDSQKQPTAPKKTTAKGTNQVQTPTTGPTPFPHSPSCANVVHYNITCDGCEAVIQGSRYKCGNCPNYDLCESCEQWSETIHRPDHVFLKIKIPAIQAGINRKGKLRPLLKTNIYQSTCHSSDEDESPKKSNEQFRRYHHRHHRHHDRDLNMEAVLATSGYITRQKDKLKEELKARKREEKERSKIEKEKAKMEKRVEKLGSKLAATTVSTPTPPATESGHLKQRGHGKYLDFQFIADTCYPDNSLVPFQVPFEKGWLVMNSGTKKWKHVKLVHTDGFRPLCPEVDVPEVKPGERVELVAKYPPITDSSVDCVKSSWRLFHKETTAFGPLLWLQVRVDKPPLVIYPPAITVPAVTPPLPEQSLTNENLLKSIGFLPGDSASGKGDSGLPNVTEDEELLTTFDVVETPQDTVHSLSSFGSVSEPPSQDFEDIKTVDAASVASDDSDFVVVIPDCFDLDKPLPGFSSTRSLSSLNEPTASVKSHDSHVTSQDETVPPKVEAPGDPQLVPVGGASPDAAQKANFVPERITLKQVRGSRLYRNPITVATGLVNTVTDLVDKRVNFVPKKTVEARPDDDSNTSDSDDTFEDAPEPPCPMAAQPWQNGQPADISKWVKSEDSEDMSRWCHNPDVSHLVPLRWDGPKTPATPMDRLIGMGFADRQLNARLLEKHENNLGAVLNELLDDQRQAFGGASSYTYHV